MKKTFLGAVLLALCFMFMTSTASATTACSALIVSDVNPGPPEGGATNTANANSTSINCNVGPLDFLNFAYEANTPGTLQPVDLSGCEGAAGCLGSAPAGTYGISLNPNLVSPPTTDISLLFEIISSSPITSVTLVNSGNPNANVQERVCDSSGLNGGTLAGGELQNGTCAGSQLANFSGAAGTSQTVNLSSPSNTIWIWKDVNVSGTGSLSNFQQGFTVNTAPEPATMALAGAALLGLGLLRRRKQA